MNNINMFTDPVTSPIMTVLFIICCLAGVVFLIMENWPKANKKSTIQKTARYEKYIIVDDEIIYPHAVIEHVDEQA